MEDLCPWRGHFPPRSAVELGNTSHSFRTSLNASGRYGNVCLWSRITATVPTARSRAARPRSRVRGNKARGRLPGVAPPAPRPAVCPPHSRPPRAVRPSGLGPPSERRWQDQGLSLTVLRRQESWSPPRSAGPPERRPTDRARVTDNCRRHRAGQPSHRTGHRAGQPATHRIGEPASLSQSPSAGPPGPPPAASPRRPGRPSFAIGRTLRAVAVGTGQPYEPL